jgi:SAM-dependent methyltransferase
MAPVVKRHAQGRCLDLGAGRLAWKALLTSHVTQYCSADVTRAHERLDLVLDVTAGLPFRGGTFDTVFCCSVLEHAKEPWDSFAEMWRILSDDGVAIVSLPFVLHLHDEPHDYYRFTRYGFEHMARRAGFRVEEMVVNGGLFHLILNVPSVAMSSCLAALGLRSAIRPTTRVWLGIARFLDRMFRGKLFFASNHIAALRKAHDRD